MTAGVAECFAIAKHADGATVRLVLAGDLDVCTAETLVVFVGNATAVPGVHAVLIDLRAVSFLDAAGIRALLRVQDSAAGHRVAVRVTGAHGVVDRVLRITGAHPVLTGGAP
jgi:anti-anti-sigma factor